MCNSSQANTYVQQAAAPVAAQGSYAQPAQQYHAAPQYQQAAAPVAAQHYYAAPQPQQAQYYQPAQQQAYPVQQCEQAQHHHDASPGNYTTFSFIIFLMQKFFWSTHLP